MGAIEHASRGPVHGQQCMVGMVATVAGGFRVPGRRRRPTQGGSNLTWTTLASALETKRHKAMRELS
jgi:hypothetical protein